MASSENKANSHRRGTELEKFKRRMIRSVARRMKEKKTDAEVWEEMKKEIGSNCKKLWERMRMLTLKKLKRLLEADDRVCQIGPVARMTLTDWLLFDLVIVHEKIDVIDREKLTDGYQSKVLSNLFALVQRFEIEGRTGDNLAEAWTAATVYYNSKGHQCSPMMLQRRWYQIKELTRHKFYKFWFNYRGNQRQLINAMQDSPDELQKAIAIKYPQIITQKFANWEERIENQMVILPDELAIKMRQRNLMKPSDTSAPDVVLVEPQIEVIDLGANSDTDENEQEDDSEIQPPTVKVKSEPVDIDKDIEEEYEVHIPPEKGSEFDEEIERLQMVEENFDKGLLQNNEGVSIVIDPEPSIADFKEVTVSNTDTIETKDNKTNFTPIDTKNVTSFSIVDGVITNVNKNEEEIVIDHEDDYESVHIDASQTTKDDTETVVSIENVTVEKDSHISDDNDHDGGETSDNYIGETVYNLNGVIAKISSVASVGIKVENVDTVIESRNDNLDGGLMTGIISEEQFPVIATVSSAGIKVETDLAINNTIDIDMAKEIDNVEYTSEDLVQSGETSEVLPMNSAVSSGVVKVEIEQNEDDILKNRSFKQEESCLVEPEDDVDLIEYDINEPTDTLVKKELPSAKVSDLEVLGDIPIDLNFVDDGIDFADDGIAYIEEDEDDIITIRDPPQTKTEKVEELKETNKEVNKSGEDSSDEEPSEHTKVQTFDLKLLMCPVVYTIKLDAMTVFDDFSRYEQVYDKESIDKIYALSKPVSKQSVTMSDQVIIQDETDDANETNSDQVEDTNYTGNVSDGDLFRNKTTEESDSDSEVIDDSKRVKLSSYMLKKPKQRTYNPVLLCKNPDFNTRLKKLSVGFFMSARNRTLLQSCIPMTIDMSKAFEDKLINGTLYLKPTPNDTVITIQDDVEVASVALVNPTTVQQSLMNIDDTLENELKKRMAERVRAINLPDISQVRRLNQHLLTAEVTPLRLENEVSDGLQNTIIGPINYVQNIKKDIDNLLSQHTHTGNENMNTNKNNINMNTDYEIILEDQPDPTLEEANPPVLRAESTPPPPEVERSPPQPVLNNTAPSTTNVADSTIARTAPNSGTTKVRKPTRKTYYPELAWNKRPFFPTQTNQDQFHSDALLTIDTLYKMLSALDPCSIYKETFPIKKKKKKINKKGEKTDVVAMNEEISNESKSNKRTSNVNTNEEIPHESTTKKDTVIDITDDEVVPVDMKPKVKTRFKIRTKDNEYCCWCSYRIDYCKGNVCRTIAKRRHRCKPLDCICCCKDLYTEFSETIITVPNERDSVQFIADVLEEQRISETIEHVVQLVKQTKEPEIDTSTQIDLDKNASQIETLTMHNAVDTQTSNVPNDLDVTQSNSTITNDVEVTHSTSTITNDVDVTHSTSSITNDIHVTPADSSDNGPAELMPLCSPKTPKFRVYTGNSVHSKRLKTRIVHPTTELTRNNNKHDSRVVCNPYAKTRPVDISPQPNFVMKDINSPVTNSCTCRPNISKVKQGRIEINGSNNCKLHKKNIKEIVLSKKLVTDENQPFFVGKGKILLTNKRMPGKKIVQPAPPTPQVESISLPAGIQIVLLPDQTLTYVLAPDVTLTPDESAILPQFLLAIQQQINAVGVTLPANHSVAKTDEVIDLDQDEPESITAANTENAPLTKPIVAIPTSGSGDESTSKEDADLEIDSIANKNNIMEKKSDERIDILTEQINKVETSNQTTIEKTGSTSKTNLKDNESKISNEESIESSDHDKNNLEKERILSTDDATNKKSLLSDLMEMSGIMEEDLAPPPLSLITTPIVQEPIILDASNFILQREVPPSEIDNPKSVTIPLPSQEPVSPMKYSANNKDGKFELTAVTSFAELKYSCDNNGLFFKLDLETGQLNSINVCIQKFPHSKAQPTTEKSVIDLTDDPDISITGRAMEEGSNSSVTKITTQHEPKIQITTILQKKQRLMQRLSNNLKPVNILQSKRHVARILKRNRSLLRNRNFSYYSKSTTKKVDTKIDLVDSDTPMEEEYLVTSSDDSSDDEPLCKKAKRIHSAANSAATGPSTEADQVADIQGKELNQNKPCLEQEITGDPQLNVQNSSNDQELLNIQQRSEEQEQTKTQANLDDQVIDEPIEQDLEEDNIHQEHSDEEMDDSSEPNVPTPVPTNLVLSGGAFNAHNIPLNTTYRSEDDSQDEDCILGV